MTAKTELPDTMPCKRCEGAGTQTLSNFGAPEGVYRPARTRLCVWCNGAKTFARPDIKALLQSILSKRSSTGLVSKRPKDDRAAYLWRWIRFHGGQDVTLPMTFDLYGDPYEDYLGEVAQYAARRMYGHRSVGVTRWGNLLTNTPLPTAGLPATAQSCGPVVTDDHDKTTMAMLEDERAGYAEG